jgi:phosphatidate cytidylyltransferase
MLRTRILTALLLLGSVMLAAWLSPLALLGGVALLVAAVLFEWLRLSGLAPVPCAALATVWAGAGFTCEALGVRPGVALLRDLLLLCMAAWALVAMALVLAQRDGLRLRPRTIRTLGFFFTACVWLALLELLRAGYGWTFSVLSIIWLADIGAYAAGRAFGRRKLASKVSPGKTWEGVWGALAIVLGAAFAVRAAAPDAAIFSTVLLGTAPLAGAVVLVLLVAASIVGDLFESLVKRQAGAKDSGALLPGHGGAWDRFDALLPAVPLAVLVQIALATPP